MIPSPKAGGLVDSAQQLVTNDPVVYLPGKFLTSWRGIDIEVIGTSLQAYLERRVIDVFTGEVRVVQCSIRHGFLLVDAVSSIIPD
jgi:hypothetical protein